MIIAMPLDPADKILKINSAYADYISASGHTPLLTAPQTDLNMVRKVAGGLLLPGGIDVDPTYYRRDNFASYNCCREKDDFERALLEAFMKEGKPIFGICRGAQLLAYEYIAAFNPEQLSMRQHIEGHNQGDHGLSRGAAFHYVEVRPDLLYGDTPTKGVPFDRMVTNSMHHQFLCADLEGEEGDHRSFEQTLADGIDSRLTVTAFTVRGLDMDTDDVVVEGFKITGWSKSIIAAVQWHPEELEDVRLIQHHFGSATRRGRGRAAAK